MCQQGPHQCDWDPDEAPGSCSHPCRGTQLSPWAVTSKDQRSVPKWLKSTLGYLRSTENLEDEEESNDQTHRMEPTEAQS